MEPGDLKSFVSRLDEIYQDTRNKYAEQRRRVGENRAFARGLQHGVTDDDGRFIPFKAKDPRIHLETFPVIGPALSTAVERRNAAWPALEVRAPTTGVVAAIQAETMEDIARDLRSQRWDYFLQDVICDYAADTDGGCFGKTYWDPGLGTPTGDPNMPMSGDWKFEAISINDALMDPIADSWDKARFVIHRKVFARTDAEARFPVDFLGQPTKGRFEALTGRRRGIGGNEVPYRGFSGTDENQAVEVIEFWWKPGPEYPNGMFCAMSGHMLIALELDEAGAPRLPDIWPWDFNFGMNIVPFAPIPDGIVTRLISMQRSLNHGVTRMRQALNWGSMPAFLIPEQSEIVQKSFSDIGGDVVRYRAPFEPKIMSGPGVTAGHLSYVDNIRNAINDVSGQTDESRGFVQSANATGARLRAGDALNARLHGTNLALKSYFIASVTQKIFTLMAMRYGPERILHARGRNNETRVMLFIEGLINPDCQFRIDPSSTTPKSRDAELQEARADFAAGAFDDTPSAERFRRVTGLYRGSAEVRDEKDIDYRRAREEDAMFLLAARRGAPAKIEPQFADDHEIHLAVHRMTMLEPEFLALPQQVRNAYIQTMVVPHQQMRDALLAEQMPAPGSAPGEEKGRPSPPAERGAPGRPGGSTESTTPKPKE